MIILKADEFEVHDQIADASCFYFPSIEIGDLAEELSNRNSPFVARPGRIEVTDKDGPLHYHEGATIVFITSGYGTIRFAEGSTEVRTGDIVLLPPRTQHLSIAASGTTMIEHIVFLGEEGDLQATYEA